MNVLIVTFLTGSSPSGVVTYYQTLARDLRGQGATVQVVETTDTPFVWNKLLNYLGHVFKRLGRVSRILWHESSYFVRLYLGARQHRHKQIDVIHAQDVRSGVAAFYALGKKVPVVLTAHFNDDPVTEWLASGPMPIWLQRGITRWYGWLFSKVNNYVFVSNYAYHQSKHLLPANTNRVILPNTVTIDPSMLEGRSEQAGESFIISNVGYVDERKNQELLIRIAHEFIQQGFTHFQIWLIGDGPKRAEYTQLVTDLGLTNNVRFWGRQAEPWRLVAQSDLYVHTALNDNCPYALLEAFAVEVPVLALPVGGIPELMPPDAGLLEGRDPVSLAAQILAYGNADKREHLTARQAQFAQTNLSHTVNLRRLWDFYEACIGARREESMNVGEKQVVQLSSDSSVSPTWLAEDTMPLSSAVSPSTISSTQLNKSL